MTWTAQPPHFGWLRVIFVVHLRFIRTAFLARKLFDFSTIPVNMSITPGVHLHSLERCKFVSFPKLSTFLRVAFQAIPTAHPSEVSAFAIE